MATDSHKQIRQMVNFILQEAHEKAAEIRIKTDHDFNLEKQVQVHNAKQRIQEEYARKEKSREVEARIAASAAQGEARMRKLVARDELLQGVLVKIRQRLAGSASNQAQYTQLLQQLIVQGMIKLDETNIVVRCRQADLAQVKSVADAARSQYVDLMREQTGDVLSPTVTVDEENHLPPPPSADGANFCAGGVVLTAYGGRIECDNTLDARASLAFRDLLPQVRALAFGSS